ncbi:MAG: hypothetical protein KAY37_11745 [Phycisphaerae bacterium]|nr:hypothetical protein [Phycisphaerae bacterium]
MWHNRLVLLAFITIGVGLCVPVAAAAHPGQTLSLKISVRDEQVRYEILISADLLRSLMSADRLSYKLTNAEDGYRFVDPEEEQRFRQAIQAMFEDSCPVTVDGVLRQPVQQVLQFVPAAMPVVPDGPYELPPDLELVLAYPLEQRPKQVALVWGLYPQDPARALWGLSGAVEVPALLDAYDEIKIIIFRDEEPAYIWHAPLKRARKAISPVVTEFEPETLPIPLLSLGVIVVWGLGLLGLRFSSLWPRLRRPILPLSIIPLGVALAAHDVLVTRVVSPWGETVVLPADEEATKIFTTLQRNVYAAFEKKTESDIYDVLAQSVDGDLLDQIYNEVYQSLILRDQGGAVARIKDVDIKEAALEFAGVLPNDQAAAFRMRTRWQVLGEVYHWGHVHSRTNEYKALYTVAQRDGAWKITAVADAEQRRIIKEDDDPILTPVPASPEPPS